MLDLDASHANPAAAGANSVENHLEDSNDIRITSLADREELDNEKGKSLSFMLRIGPDAKYPRTSGFIECKYYKVEECMGATSRYWII